MSTFLNNIPQPGDLLSFSQGQLLSNNAALSSIFGIDHYPFVDTSASQGFHNKVTTPLIGGGTHPTTVANPVFYGMTETQVGSSLPIGLIEYSRGPNNAVPSPVTTMQSSATAIVLAPTATTNVIDFTGLARCYGMLYAGDLNSVDVSAPYNMVAFVSWTGTVITISLIVQPNVAQILPSKLGNILQIKAGTVSVTGLYWTFQLLRTS